MLSDQLHLTKQYRSLLPEGTENSDDSIQHFQQSSSGGPMSHDENPTEKASNVEINHGFDMKNLQEAEEVGKSINSSYNSWQLPLQNKIERNNTMLQNLVQLPTNNNVEIGNKQKENQINKQVPPNEGIACSPNEQRLRRVSFNPQIERKSKQIASFSNEDYDKCDSQIFRDNKNMNENCCPSMFNLTPITDAENQNQRSNDGKGAQTENKLGFASNKNVHTTRSDSLKQLNGSRNQVHDNQMDFSKGCENAISNSQPKNLSQKGSKLDVSASPALKMEDANTLQQTLRQGLIIKLRENSIKLTNLDQPGTRETTLLRNTVILNLHGQPKPYAKRSLNCINSDNFVRRKILWLVEWKLFEYFILLAIIVNSVAMAMFDYSDRESKAAYNQRLDQINAGCTAVFTMEALLKILAYGFIKHPRSYIRDVWNIIDFIVVITGIIELSLASNSRELRLLRTIRVLRPLKTINSLPDLKKHVDVFVATLPNFINVAIFLIFCFILMAILGLHQYGLRIYNRCRYSENPEIPGVSWKIVESDPKICSQNGRGMHECDVGQYCGNPFDADIPLANDEVNQNYGIFYGIPVFNNIGTSLILINQFVSTDGWSIFMYNLMDVDHPALAIIYSLVNIIVGNFFIMNLILAVISDEFVKYQELQQKKHELQSKEPLIDLTYDSLVPQIEGGKLGNSMKLGHSLSFEKMEEPLEDEEAQRQEQTNEIKLITAMPRGKINQVRNLPAIEYNKEEPEKDKSLVYKESNERQENQAIEEEKKEDNSAYDSNKEPYQYPSPQSHQSQNQSLHKSNNSESKVLIDSSYHFTEDHPINNEYGSHLNNADSQHDDIQSFMNNAMDKLAFYKGKARIKKGVLRQLEQDMVKVEKEKSTKDKLKERFNDNPLYRWSYYLIKSDQFNAFITVAIFANVIVQALDQYPDVDYIKYHDVISSSFSIFFIAELIFKMLGLGFKFYFLDPFNKFDCLIVVSSIVDVVVSYVLGNMSVNDLTVLRAFRLMRLFKLAKIWRTFQQLLRTISKTLKDIAHFSIIIVLFMFIYSILGMEIYASKLKLDYYDNFKIDLAKGRSLNTNFDNFHWSFVTVFVLLTEDNWSYVYQEYYRGLGGFRANLFFLSLYIIGPKLLLNLFIAILLEDFNEDNLALEIAEKSGVAEYLKQNTDKTQGILTRTINWITEKIIDPVFGFVKKYDDTEDDCSPRKSPQEQREIQKITSIQSSFFRRWSNLYDNEIETRNINKAMSRRFEQMELERQTLKKSLHGKSYNLFGRDNTFRNKLNIIVQHDLFDKIIILAILVSSVHLALSSPLVDPNSAKFTSLYWIDFGITMVFLLEFVIKSIAYGLLFNGPTSYLRNVWNFIDFVIMVLSMVSISPLVNRLQVFKMFRVGRVLRLISRAEGLRIGVQSILQAIPNVFRIVLIMLLFFVIFGIIAISQFKGRFYICDEQNILSVFPNYRSYFTVKDKWDCINSGSEWQKLYYNFDNIYQAMVSLFIIANVATWSDFMYRATQVTDIDLVHERESQPYIAYFFIVFMVVGSFFLLNLFFGVVFSSFMQQKNKVAGNSEISDTQCQYLQVHLLVLRSSPTPKIQPGDFLLSRFCFRLYQHLFFDVFIYLCILLNTIVLCLEWPDQSYTADMIIGIFNYAFTGIFTLEAIIKLIALRKLYFYDAWNIFDFSIVVISLAAIVLLYTLKINVGSAFTIVRAFRIAKLLKNSNRFRSLWNIVKTFIVALKPLASIGTMLLLVLYLYAIAGVNLFAQVKRNGVLSESLNFESFPTAALTLFVIATGDGWTEILHSCVKTRSLDNQCIDNPTFAMYQESYSTVGCGPGFGGHFYFYSYYLVMNLILLKLFTAIICEVYNEILNMDNIPANSDQIDWFNQHWSYFDPDASHYIQIKDIHSLLDTLNATLLGYPRKNMNNQEKDDFIMDMELPIYGNFTYFNYTDVLDAMASRVTVRSIVKKAIQKEIEDKIYSSDVQKEAQEADENDAFEDLEDIQKESKQNDEESQQHSQEANKVEDSKSSLKISNKKSEKDLITQSFRIQKNVDPATLVTEERCREVREQILKELNELAQSEKAHQIMVIKDIEDIVKEKRKARKQKEDLVAAGKTVLDPRTKVDRYITSRSYIHARNAAERWLRKFRSLKERGQLLIQKTKKLNQLVVKTALVQGIFRPQLQIEVHQTLDSQLNDAAVRQVTPAFSPRFEKPLSVPDDEIFNGPQHIVENGAIDPINFDSQMQNLHQIEEMQVEGTMAMGSDPQSFDLDKPSSHNKGLNNQIDNNSSGQLQGLSEQSLERPETPKCSQADALQGLVNGHLLNYQSEERGEANNESQIMRKKSSSQVSRSSNVFKEEEKIGSVPQMDNNDYDNQGSPQNFDFASPASTSPQVSDLAEKINQRKARPQSILILQNSMALDENDEDNEPIIIKTVGKKKKKANFRLKKKSKQIDNFTVKAEEGEKKELQ